MRDKLLTIAFASLLSLSTATSRLDAADPATTDDSAPAEKPQPIPRKEKKSDPKQATSSTTPTTATRDLRVATPIVAEPLPVKKDPKTGQEVFVITNDDLDRRFGGSRATTPYLPPPLGNATGTTNGTASPAAGGAGSVDAAERAKQVEADLERLKANTAKIKNPFLGRPQLTEGERQKVQGMDNAERLKQTQGQIAALEAELQKLRDADDSPDK